MKQEWNEEKTCYEVMLDVFSLGGTDWACVFQTIV